MHPHIHFTMKKFFLLLIAATNLLFAKAQTTDQQNTGANTSYQVINSGNEVSKQTFKAGLSGKLTTVHIDMEITSCPQLNDMNVNITVYDSTGNHVLGNTIVNFGVPTARGLQPFNLSTPVYLLANHTYAFEITVPSGQLCDTPSVSANILWYYGFDEATYSNGVGYFNYTPFGYDYYFKTDVMVCANPVNGYISAIGYETCESGDGSVICNTSGGVGPFTYLWNTSDTDSALINLSSGNYSVVVSDGANCGDHDFYFLPNAGTGVTADDTAVATTCFALCNGSASITVLTGTAPYTYLWSNADTNATVNNLCAGNYTYTVTDINNCTFSNTVTVLSPNEISASFVTNNESCMLNDGSIDMTPVGDFPPFSYSWTHGPTTQDVNFLASGFYQVTIVDQNGCSQVVGETVGYNPGAVIDTLQLDIQNNLCFQSNGHIADLGTGVTTSNPPLNYTLDFQSISSYGAYNLTGGTYTLIAIDAMGCSDTTTITIQDIGSPITVGQGSSFHPVCPDLCNGTAQVGVAGGNLPYTYEWSNGLTVANGMDLCPGEYSVLVTDADGCSATAAIVINAPAPIVVNYSVTEPSCGANDGSAQATVTSGGSAPFTYSWSNGDDTDIADTLNAGNYSVMVQDASQCKVYTIVSVNNSSGPTVTESLINPTCNGFSDGAIDLTITGGAAPIQVQWSTGHTTEDLVSLPAGVYDVTVTDASGCTIHKSYELQQNAPITITTSFTLPTCSNNDGEISVIPSGGTAPFTFVWDANAGNATTATVNNLFAGVYEVTVTDANACSEIFEIGLSNDNAPMITTDQIIHPNCQTGGGNILITVSGGTAPYNYLWSNGAFSADLENVSEGNYSITITDAAGCAANASYELPGINIFAQPICMITVDSVTNMNKVVWEKTAGIGIAEFKIYRQTSNPYFYLHVGTVPFDSLSVFNDTVASSDIHAWKYKLATVDSCGNESDFYASHKTIHLITSADANGDVTLEWDDYIGFTYSEFYINRYHISTGWEIIDTVPASVHSYFDPAAPAGNVGYAISVPSPSNCEPSRVGVNTSRSNVKNQPVISPVEVNENEKLNAEIYPNPAQNEVIISLPHYISGNCSLTMYNAIGEVVLTQNLNQMQNRIDVKNLANGVYTISLTQQDYRLIKKLVVNK